MKLSTILSVASIAVIALADTTSAHNGVSHGEDCDTGFPATPETNTDVPTKTTPKAADGKKPAVRSEASQSPSSGEKVDQTGDYGQTKPAESTSGKKDATSEDKSVKTSTSENADQEGDYGHDETSTGGNGAVKPSNEKKETTSSYAESPASDGSSNSANESSDPTPEVVDAPSKLSSHSFDIDSASTDFEVGSMDVDLPTVGSSSGKAEESAKDSEDTKDTPETAADETKSEEASSAGLDIHVSTSEKFTVDVAASAGLDVGVSASAGLDVSVSASADASEASAANASSAGSSASDASAPSKPSGGASDPFAVDFNLTALAIGDWGARYQSCCNDYDRKGVAHYKDQQAQDQVAYLMSLSAEELHPKAVIGHGDNFYWNGISMKDQQARFDDTYESKYSQESLLDIPWYNVMGNHDYGGSEFLCGRDDHWRKCKSIEEALDMIDERFEAQSSYVSPNNDRWHMPDHYYKVTLEDEESGVTVDIYNVDTNAATVHGSHQICCQCYAYTTEPDGERVNCNHVQRGDAMCFGGDTDAYDQCMEKFQNWYDESLSSMAADAAASTADWKLVNSHYMPQYHFNEPMINEWNKALHDNGVHMFLGGHTHAEKMDVLQRENDDFKTYFVLNGAGGGLQSQLPGVVPEYAKGVTELWRANGTPYGYFELGFSKDWLKIRFITFADDWQFESKLKETVQGSRKPEYCLFIPKDSSLDAVECTEE